MVLRLERLHAEGHALSTPFGALKHDLEIIIEGATNRGMPSQRPSGH